MSKYLLTLTFFCFVLGCTPSSKKGGQKVSSPGLKSQSAMEYLPYKSALKYGQGTLKSSDSAAEIEGEPVSWSQLTSNEPALVELEERWLKAAVAFTNTVTEDLVAQKKLPEGTVEVQLFFPQPEGEASDWGVVNSDTVKTEFKGFVAPGVLAQVGEHQLFEKDLLKTSLSAMKLYENLFTQRMRRLNGIAVRRYLLKASKTAQLGMEEYVRSKILKGDSAVTEAMVRDYAAEKGIAESDINEDMIKKLEAIVSQHQRDRKIEDYVAKNLNKEIIKVAFQGPSRAINIPKLSDSVPFWGQDSGKPLLYVGHWSCERCKESLSYFLKGRSGWSQKFRGAFLFFFPKRDREARMSAEASLCLHNQKPEYFWSFIESSLESENPNTEVAINDAAKNSGADFESFRKCFLDREYQKTVDNHLAMVDELGVMRAPLMALEGNVIADPTNLSALTELLGAPAAGMASVAKSHQKASKSVGFFGRIYNFIANLFS